MLRRYVKGVWSNDNADHRQDRIDQSQIYRFPGHHKKKKQKQKHIPDCTFKVIAN